MVAGFACGTTPQILDPYKENRIHMALTKEDFYKLLERGVVVEATCLFMADKTDVDLPFTELTTRRSCHHRRQRGATGRGS